MGYNGVMVNIGKMMGKKLKTIENRGETRNKSKNKSK